MIDKFYFSESTRVRRKGDWSVVSDIRYSGGEYLKSSDNSSEIVFSSIFNRLYINALKGPGLGSFEVYIDDTLVDTVDLNDALASENYDAAIEIAGTYQDVLHVVSLKPVSGEIYVDSAFCAI